MHSYALAETQVNLEYESLLKCSKPPERLVLKKYEVLPHQEDLSSHQNGMVNYGRCGKTKRNIQFLLILKQDLKVYQKSINLWLLVNFRCCVKVLTF